MKWTRTAETRIDIYPLMIAFFFAGFVFNSVVLIQFAEILIIFKISDVLLDILTHLWSKL